MCYVITSSAILRLITKHILFLGSTLRNQSDLKLTIVFLSVKYLLFHWFLDNLFSDKVYFNIKSKFSKGGRDWNVEPAYALLDGSTGGDTSSIASGNKVSMSNTIHNLMTVLLFYV